MAERTGVCQDCNETFTAGQRGKIGARCKPCAETFKREQTAAWKAANPDRYQRYYAKNAERLQARNAAWRAANPDYHKNHYRQNREQYIAKAAEWTAVHRERSRSIKAEWQTRNRVAVTAKQQRRRARQVGTVVEQFTLDDVIERDGTACGICGSEVDLTLSYPDPWSKSLDHVIPLASPLTSHTIANAQLAHLNCNVRKGARMD